MYDSFDFYENCETGEYADWSENEVETGTTGDDATFSNHCEELVDHVSISDNPVAFY